MMIFFFEKVFWSCACACACACACVYGHLKPYVFLSSHIFFYAKIQRFFICNTTISQTKYYLCKSEFVVRRGRRRFWGVRFEVAF